MPAAAWNSCHEATRGQRHNRVAYKGLGNEMLTWLSNRIPDVYSKVRQALEILHKNPISDTCRDEQINSQLIGQNIGLNRLSELWSKKIPLCHIARGH
ncbi:hypothetical protein D9M69_716260 [compost metagenome]